MAVALTQAEVLAAINGKRVLAIKLCRDRTGLSLKEAHASVKSVVVSPYKTRAKGMWDYRLQRLHGLIGGHHLEWRIALIHQEQAGK